MSQDIQGKVYLAPESSLIESYIWWSDNSLTINFRNKDRYRYKNVSQEFFDQFDDAPSKGSFFVKHIKNKFETEKVELGLLEDINYGPWPFPKSLPETNENFDDILEWNSSEEQEFLNIIQEQENGNDNI